jgi:hypothetical protein
VKSSWFSGIPVLAWLVIVLSGVALLTVPFVARAPLGWDAFSLALLMAYLATLVMLTFGRNLFANIYVLYSAAFFVQRIFVVMLIPGQLDYQDHIHPTNAEVHGALGILILANLATAAALVFFLLWRSRKTRPGAGGLSLVSTWWARLREEQRSAPQGLPAAGERLIPWKDAPVESILFIYAGIFFPLTALNLWLKLAEHVGIAGVVYSHTFAILYRLSFISNSLTIFAWVVLLSPSLRRSARITAGAVLAVFVLETLVQGSRAALAGPLLFSSGIAFVLLGRRLSGKHVAFVAVICIATVLLFEPISIFRSDLISNRGFLRALHDAILGTPFNLGADFLAISFRLGGYDVLLAFMTVGPAQFAAHVGPWFDFIDVVNSFVPGQLISDPSEVPFAQLMVVVLRGLPIASIGGYGENPGVFGMAYIFYGFLGSAMFVGLWALGCIAILRSSLSTVLKSLFAYQFILVLALGGSVVTPILRFYEGAMVLFCCWALFKVMARFGIPRAGYHRTQRTDKPTMASARFGGADASICNEDSSLAGQPTDPRGSGRTGPRS